MIDWEDTKAPPEPWSFPPIHVMPTEPNGTMRNEWHCVRCGALLKNKGGTLWNVKRCNEYHSKPGMQGKESRPYVGIRHAR